MTATSSSNQVSDTTSTASYEPIDDDEVAKLKDSELERKLADWANSQYIKCKSDITPIRNQWYINLAFYKGDQYVSLLRGKLIRAPQVPGRIRLVVNRIRPAVRTEIARMTSQKPIATVVPASSEEEDITAAEAGEATWEYIYATKGIDRAFKQAAFWTSTCGIGYIKTVWDDDVEDKESSLSKGEKVTGDLCYSAPTPFHIMVPDSLQQNLQDQPYILHIYTMSIEEVKDRWPDKIDPDHTPTVVSTNEIMETRYLNLVGAEETAKPDSCLVIEAWVKPNATNLLPDGGMFISVDKQIVYKDTDGIPFNHKEFPFTKIENVPSGTYWSTSTLEDLIPIQKEINRSRSQIVENRNHTMKAGYFIKKGAVDTNKWTSKPGQLIEVNMGFPDPVPMPIPPMPNYVGEEQEYMMNDFEDISGQHQVSKGSAPSGVTAATAINFLQERDDSYMAPVYDSIETAIQNVARQSLILCEQYWDDARIIKAIGQDMAFSTMELKGADLKNGTDIRIEGGSALPVSKAAKNALIMDMMNRGMLPPEQGFKIMDMPSMRSYFEISEVDERQAKRENMKLCMIDPAEIQEAVQMAQNLKNQYLIQQGFVKQGQPDPMTGIPQPVGDEATARNNPVIAQMLDKFDAPIIPVNDWDNDQVHIQWHENFMKSQRYETLDPIVQEQFVKHDEAHKAKLQSKMLSQMMMGGQAGGGQPQGSPQGVPAKGPNGGHNAGGNNQFSNQTAPQAQPVDAGQPQ